MTSLVLLVCCFTIGEKRSTNLSGTVSYFAMQTCGYGFFQYRSNLDGT